MMTFAKGAVGSVLLGLALLMPADASARHDHQDGHKHRPKEKCSYGWMKQCTPIARRMDCRWIRYKGCTTVRPR